MFLRDALSLQSRDAVGVGQVDPGWVCKASPGDWASQPGKMPRVGVSRDKADFCGARWGEAPSGHELGGDDGRRDRRGVAGIPCACRVGCRRAWDEEEERRRGEGCRRASNWSETRGERRPGRARREGRRVPDGAEWLNGDQ